MTNKVFEKVKAASKLFIPFDRIGDVKGIGVSKDNSKFGISADFGDFYEGAKKVGIHKNPIMANAADYVNWVLYDTLLVAANTSIGANFKFFTTPIGGTKTKMQTNMDLVQQLPNPQWFNCIGIGFEFGNEVTQADIQTLINNYYMEFWVGNKTYVEGIYTKFPSGGGVNGYVNSDAAAAPLLVHNLTNGVPQLSNMFDLRLPSGIRLGTDQTGQPVFSDGLTGITILQSQQFKVENNAPGGAQSTSASGSGLRFRCDLIGILNRGVQ